MEYCIYCMKALAESSRFCPECGTPQAYECPAHHLLPGTVLNRKFVVGAALGEGGFGITYIGRDVNLDVKVAIKEYYPNGYANRNNTNSAGVTEPKTVDRKDFYEKGRKSVLNEARALARFRGEPGIVDVLDFFEENNTAYIVMEYLEGRTLKNYIQENGAMNDKDAVNMLLPVMQSLQKVHREGIIHRDISPDNIMIVGSRVKLLDFGAARTYSAEANRSLSVMLKPGYAPEEQYRTKGKQGPWTDIYALCATVYKCITGVTPDDANERVINDELKRPSELGIAIDPKIEAVLMKGLSVFAPNRYQNIESMLADLSGNGADLSAAPVPEENVPTEYLAPADAAASNPVYGAERTMPAGPAYPGNGAPAAIALQLEVETKRRLAEQAGQEAAGKEAAASREKKKKLLRRAALISGSAAACAGVVLALSLYVIPTARYKKGEKALSQEEYDDAIACFSAIGNYQDAEDQLQEARYLKAVSLMETENFSEAKELFDDLGSYRDSPRLSDQSGLEEIYQEAQSLFEQKKYEEAADKFEQTGDVRDDAAERTRESRYMFGAELLGKKKYQEAEEQFILADGWKDAAEKKQEAQYSYAAERFEEADYETAYRIFSGLAGYKDSDTLLKEAKLKYARQVIEKKDWQIAVGLLEQIVPYSDSTALLKESKYQYVLENKNASDPVTHDYLEFLKKEKYRDSAAIYTALYPEKKDSELRTGVYYSTGIYQITPDVGVNIRQTPGANNKKVGSYNCGQRITVYEVLGNWGRTDKGWICLDYTKKAGELSNGRGTGYYKISDREGLNIRSQPNVSAKKLGVYVYATVVYVYEISGDWGRTDKGWIYLYYTTKQ